MWRALAWSLVVALAVAACSEPPSEERKQAENAIAAARAADAANYAPQELQDAEAALKKYDDAVAQRDYRQALNGALEARDRAYEAVKQAGSAKIEFRTQAEQLIVELDALNTRGAVTTGAPGARAVGPAAERHRAALRAATAALQEARTLLGNMDYRGAVNVLTPAVQALRRELPVEPASPKRKK
jgi:hypothetical protein